MSFSRKTVVNGPMSPETGVMYFILDLTSLESTLPLILLPPIFPTGFFSRPFTSHSTAGERKGHFFNSSLPLPADLQTLRH